MTICVLSFVKYNKRINTTHCFNLCFNCLEKLEPSININCVCIRTSLQAAECLCSRKITYCCKINLSKEYIIKHIKNNEKMYEEKLKFLNNECEKFEEELKNTYQRDPKLVWHDKVKDLPFDIESSYENWLKKYLKEKEEKLSNLKELIKNNKIKIMKKINFLTYDRLDI